MKNDSTDVRYILYNIEVSYLQPMKRTDHHERSTYRGTKLSLSLSHSAVRPIFNIELPSFQWDVSRDH